MSKQYGKPYDPALRETEHGSKLYQIWKRIRKSPHSEAWDHFPTFYDWAMQNEYETGFWLRKIDCNGSYTPDNCVWYSPKEKKEHIPAEWADRWNKTVNRIREHYGMPPLEETDYDVL